VPRYDFRCTTCDQTYEVARPMADADAPATCPDGHVGAIRLLPMFATTGFATTGFATTGTASGPAPAPSAGGCCGGGCCS
jgi:putative FmdB family regulatory protein